ncbi:MAG: type III pantothenate kinase, partial [Isosphaeraceae bacterium]|nr:type III pantothenate kinase [Isosphaeraceae bacterium]
MICCVADLGNSRLKWGRVGPDGSIEATIALPIDDPSAWSAALAAWLPAGEPSAWAIASVNPPAAEALQRCLEGHSSRPPVLRWFRSAADVPVRHALERPETAGADRELAVSAALGLMSPGQP